MVFVPGESGSRDGNTTFVDPVTQSRQCDGLQVKKNESISYITHKKYFLKTNQLNRKHI